jgi:hypothetical protein
VNATKRLIAKEVIQHVAGAIGVPDTVLCGSNEIT